MEKHADFDLSWPPGASVGIAKPAEEFTEKGTDGVSLLSFSLCVNLLMLSSTLHRSPVVGPPSPFLQGTSSQVCIDSSLSRTTEVTPLGVMELTDMLPDGSWWGERKKPSFVIPYLRLRVISN